jgi:site-specific DNA-methyltransferase (cytosine-N4-specific)
MQLVWHPYRYYPYERELASREVAALFKGSEFRENANGLELAGIAEPQLATRLTYFSGMANGQGIVETLQSRLEREAGTARRRQSTRYSVHGLHEYKGKFNPQVVRAILNIFSIESGDHVLDPFCGSGTTLVECAHMGANGFGTDLNPLAVYIANAKLQALAAPYERLEEIQKRISSRIKKQRSWTLRRGIDSRQTYLQSWFLPSVLQKIEIVGDIVKQSAAAEAPIFLVILSNLLRGYSQQDPKDLRIRRRTSALPEKPFEVAFLDACAQAIERLRATQSLLGADNRFGKAELRDVTRLNQKRFSGSFDAAITSPPYATALPYIDTQRLSLTWLNLISPAEILPLEAELIGSREIRGKDKDNIQRKLMSNSDGICEAEANYCVRLQNSLTEKDGFRRRAVPSLLYRYFANMQSSFRAIRPAMKRGAKFALIVGHNHTTLGGIRYEINTPLHLANLAQATGWVLDEMLPLQTYKRYDGYHVNNAVGAETLLLLRNP